MMFAMYSRFSRQFCKKFLSFGLSRGGTYITTMITSPIASNRSMAMTRSLYCSSLIRKETDTTMSGSKDIYNVNYEQILEAQKDNNVLIIDVREQPEIDETGKLPGSIHIPMGDISNVLLNVSEKDFKEKYGRHKPTKNTKLIFSCRSGKRSGVVQETAQKLGYEKSYNYIGGWVDWESRQKV